LLDLFPLQEDAVPGSGN